MNTSVKLVLDQRRSRKDNTYPVALRLIHNRQTTHVTLGYSILAKDWNAGTGEIKNSCKTVGGVNRANELILNKRSEAKTLITDMERSGELARLSISDLRRMIVGISSANETLFRFMQRLIDELKQVAKFGNARVYRDSLNVWKMYRHDKDLDLAQIDYKMLKGFENYFLARGSKPNTISVYLRTFRDYSSKLSPWLAVGSLSPRKVYHQVRKYEAEVKKNISSWWLIFELIWRDFFKYQGLKYGNAMFYRGGVRKRSRQWNEDIALFERWKQGKTSIPFIDAHMRQLEVTGFMSNRGRVNCSSFLARDYQIDWRWGASWFENKLLDYDVCSNWLNWQSQAMETRYTNPIWQGFKYDTQGEFVRTWVPEIPDLQSPAIHAPWRLDPVPKNYPLPAEVYEKWEWALDKLE